MITKNIRNAFYFFIVIFLVAGEQLYIYLCPSVSLSVSGHNSASAGARKLKFGMKDACSRISRPFFHFFKFPSFYPEIRKNVKNVFAAISQHRLGLGSSNLV